MYCRNCGKESLDSAAKFCPQCGASNSMDSLPTTNQQQSVNNHIAIAIVSCFFALIPGIIAVVYADKVNKALSIGNYDEARSASSTAQTWAIVGLVLGLVGWLIYGIAVCATASSGGYYY